MTMNHLGFLSNFRVILSFLLIFISLVGVAIGTRYFFGSSNINEMTDDEQLVSLVKKCVREQIPRMNVEDVVNRETIINTAKDGDFSALAFYGLGRDEIDTSLPYMDSDPADIICWIRPLSSLPERFRLVGIYYSKSGEGKLFFGELLEKG